MAERNFTTNFGANTSGFSKGIDEMKAKLTELNKALLDNQSQIKAANKEIKEYEKEQAKLKQAIDSGKATEDEKRRYEELTGLIEQARLRVAQYRTEQQALKSEMANVTAEMREQGKAAEENGDGFTVLKGVIADMASNVLQGAIDKFRELMTSGQQALNSIQAQTGMTKAEMATMKEQMYDLYGQNYGESLEDVANVIAAVKQNINETDPTRIEEIAKNAIAMSDTFGSDVNETLRGVNALMTHLGLSAEEAFDYIAKGSQNGLDKTGELSDNLAEYAQLWSQAGFSAGEMFSVLQNGIDSGAYSLDKVNDLVGEMTRSIIDGRLESSLDSFSNKTAQIFEAFKNGEATQSDVFDSMIDDLNNTSNLAEKLATASDTWSALGEDNAMSVIQALNNVNDTYADVSGTMQSINDIKYDDVGNQLATLGRKFEVDLIQPLVEGVTPALENILNWATDNLPLVAAGFTSVTTAVLGLKATLGISKNIDVLSKSFTALIAKIKGSATASQQDAVAKGTEAAATQGATVAQNGLNAAMAANVIGAVITLVLSLAAAFGTYSAMAGSATDETHKYTKAIEDAEQAADDSIAKTEADCKVIEQLGDRYDELRNKTNLNAAEQKELDRIAEQLAEKLGITTSELRDQSGKYQDLSDKIDTTITKMRELAEANVRQDILTEAYKQQYEAQLEIQKVHEMIDKLNEKFKGFKRDDLKDYYKGAYDELYGDLTDKLHELESEYVSCTETIDKYSEMLGTSSVVTEEGSKTSSSGAAANRDYARSAEEEIITVEDLKGKLADYTLELVRNKSEIKELKREKERLEGSGETKRLEEIKERLSDLKSEQSELNEKIKEIKEEIDEAANAVNDALDKVQDSYTQWQKVIDEVNAETNKNGTISIKTLSTIQKKYPELLDLVNDYIAGIKNESDVIAALEGVYNDDANNYKNAVKTKMMTSESFFQNLLDNNANWVNDYKDKYGIDLENFKTAQEAKVAIQAQAEERKRQELNKTLLKEADTYINSSSAELKRIGFSIKSSIGNGTYNGYNYQQQINEAGEKAVKEFNKSVASFFGNFYSADIDSALSGLLSDGSSGGTSGGSNGGTGSKFDDAAEKQKTKYALASEAYNKLIDDRIAKLEEEKEAAQKAADKEIEAINKQIEARKRLNEDKDRQSELNKINAQLTYEQMDALSRRELERKKQNLLNEQAEINWERKMSDKKSSITDRLNASNAKTEKAMEALRAAAESAKNYFDRLSGSQSNAQIVNNNTDTRNIKIIQNALSDQQIMNKLLKALYSK